MVSLDVRFLTKTLAGSVSRTFNFQLSVLSFTAEQSTAQYFVIYELLKIGNKVRKLFLFWMKERRLSPWPHLEFGI